MPNAPFEKADPNQAVAMPHASASRPSLATLAAGSLASFVGFASSFAIVVKGFLAMGATPAQATSGLISVAFAMGFCAIVLSLKTKMPISIAWSTPGAAFLTSIALPEHGFAEAVGAFMGASVLIFLAGSITPFGRWITRIPKSLANAMLAGILLTLCFAPFRALGQRPLLVLPIMMTWLVMGLWRKALAVPAAVIMAFAVIGMSHTGALPASETWIPHFESVTPYFSWTGFIGISLPLFLITMASQNIPGMAVLTLNGYHTPMPPLLRMTGLFSLASNCFGGHAVNLAAITAAMCAQADADADPARRYWAAVISGTVYVLFGLVAGAATALIAASPPLLIEAVAGLALFGALAQALMQALQDDAHREAALITFLLTASGLSFFGIGGAFWGLLGGGLVLALKRAVNKP